MLVWVPGDLAIAKSQLALKLFGPADQNIAHVKEIEVAGAQVEDSHIGPSAAIQAAKFRPANFLG
jgi:hypothetical protein